MTEQHEPGGPDQQGQDTSAQDKARRSGWFWLLVALAVLILLPVVLMVAILLALRSETGTAWVIDQVPGLEVTEGRGSLLGQWQASEVVWQGFGVNVEVEAVLVDWSPSCLLQTRICLDTLRATRLDVRVQPSAETEETTQGIDLPALELPVGVRVGDVNLGPFSLNGSRVWDRLELSAGGSGADWQLERGVYQLGDYKVTASGRVITRRDWPVDLNVQATLPPPLGDRWVVDLNLSGSVRDLRVSGQSRGYLDATLEGDVAPLNTTLPARLRITSKQFTAMDSVPDTLMLKDWFVVADGSLASGFQTRGEATLPGTEGPIALSLEGKVDTEAATDVNLTLSTRTPEGEGQASVRGQVSWQDGLKASADLSLNRFPWYSLLPELEEPAVALNRVDGSVSWSKGQYQASVEAEVEGPQGKATLSSEVDGDLEKVTLTDLRVETEAGSLSGKGRVAFAGPVSWQAALELDDFNPGYWLPALSASLSGDIETEGQVRKGTIPRVEARWDLGGQWQDKPASASGTLDTSSGKWEVTELQVSVGENELAGSGAWGDQLRGQFNLALPAPGDLLDGLAGQLNAELNIGGTPDDPTGTLTASAKKLAWQDSVTVASLNVDAAVKSGLRVDTSIRAKDVAGSGQTLESLDINVSGTRDEHRLEALVEHADASVRLLFGGGFDGDAWTAWQGALAEGQIEIPDHDQRWTLESPAALAYKVAGKGELTVGQHCWRWQQSTVCANDQTLLPTPDLAYRINNFPATALDPLLPERLRWQGHLNGEIDVTLPDSGPSGQIRIDAGSGEFEVQVEEEWEPLSYDRFVTVLKLKPDRADLDVQLAGPKLGELSVQVAVDPRSAERELEGQYSLAGLDISLAGIFAGLDEVSGQIDGQGTLSGPLMKPAVNGRLELIEGRVVDQTLPIPLEEVAISLALNGYSADISGRIRSNARSEITLEGAVDWANAPEGQVRILGERIPFSLEPYAQVELAPDLTIGFRRGELRVAGKVGVPRGSIEIRGLPEQAVTVSEDEVIVGVEREEPVIQNLDMDVTVVVGEDQVTFDAFGVTGDLKGTLRIGNNLDTRGTLELVNGTYEKFGQELELRTARILFVGNLTQPYLNIEAVRTVDTVVAGIRLSGPVQSPTTEVFSTPDMPQTSALSYIILGRAPESRGDEGQMSGAAISLGLTQANKLTGKLGAEFGIDRLTLEAEGSGEQTSVVASGYLTEELSVRYGVGVFEPITTVALRYDLGRYFYLEAASGLAASLDIFYTRDF
ncbi:translocation/assembly module TamB domain-containing protein [Marinobacter alexandrii]|uniref:translocation/assembly module TamB domain-containing protein n=1 Tax=Marinobacter alexandrii TaxID=2570351 RepID=UPI001D17D6A3|nr:translocation/assembly module TamB domain-containing protein [Marinobacter alexandrii]